MEDLASGGGRSPSWLSLAPGSYFPTRVEIAGVLGMVALGIVGYTWF